MKFLILLFYYERPEFLRNALESVKNSTHKNWEIAIIDDGTNFSASPIIDQCFTLDERIRHRISYIQTFDSEERKNLRGGSQFGEYGNTAIKVSDADVVLMLCDDDLLKPTYLEDLSSFYERNPLVKYSYCHLEFYDPTLGLPGENNVVSNNYTNYLISHNGPIDPARRVDSSQVSWRRDNWLTDGIQFPSPRTINLDEMIYKQMYSSWGACGFNQIVGQWKGIHKSQLVNTGRKR